MRLTIRNLPSPSQLREMLDYDPMSGEFAWRPRCAADFKDGSRSAEHQASLFNAIFAGRPALTTEWQGYRKGRVAGVSLKAHRVAFAHYHGRWPGELDHINRVRNDNRIANLREVTHSENGRNRGEQANNTSGQRGVSWINRDQRWVAFITYDGRQISLGHYRNFEDAVAARLNAEERLWSETMRLERKVA